MSTSIQGDLIFLSTKGLFDGTSASTIQGTGKLTSQTQEVHLQPLLGVAPLGHVPLVRERKNQLNMLEASFHHLPQRQDSERMKCVFALFIYDFLLLVKFATRIETYPNIQFEIASNHRVAIKSGKSRNFFQK